MNTLQLKRALEHTRLRKRSSVEYLLLMNYLRHSIRFPYGFVANTDPSTEPGTHWVAFYFPSRDKGEFFDSYGYPLNITDWNPMTSKRGTSINCKVRGATCVDNTVFFTFIIKVVDIA